ncbi:MAG: DUF342 domain-containing protein [Alicyclobacillaceae bacterium]|nr:DUF342 domain-containing protein [Alicyclobacillaceae bacterium]
MTRQSDPDLRELLEVEIEPGGLTARARWQSVPDIQERLRGLSLQTIERWLADNGVKFGVDEEAVRQLLAGGDSTVGQWVVVARGVPPEPGQPGKVEWLVSETDGRRKETDQGMEPADWLHRVDLRDRGGIRSVTPGTPLLRVTPPVPGRDGKSVKGERIPAPALPAVAVKLGPRVEWNEDGTEVVAKVAGHPVYDHRRRKVDVSPVYRIDGDVDYGVGHVSFEGSLHIVGSVKANFRVRASGDVVIEGAVDGGIVESGTNVEVGGGIYGGSQGKVSARGTVKAKFVQQAKVSAELDVVVSRSILHSETVAGRDILVLSPSGTIAGGTCSAVRWIRTAILGSVMAVPTTVAVGLPQSVRDRWRTLHEELRQLESQRSKLILAKQILEKRTQQGADASAGFMHEKIRAELETVISRIEETHLEIQQVAEDMQNFREAGVWVTEKVYPGVKIIIGSRLFVVNEEMARVRFILDGGEIRATPIS